ncbi:hypothetical protein WMY93_002102 [Mugilogobius chulae]|uniref:Noggin n=1 Tax=Mugilogobius chulae TaxID=88201 RepID=A0AAW0PYN4_9GOBI
MRTQLSYSCKNMAQTKTSLLLVNPRLDYQSDSTLQYSGVALTGEAENRNTTNRDRETNTSVCQSRGAGLKEKIKTSNASSPTEANSLCVSVTLCSLFLSLSLSKPRPFALASYKNPRTLLLSSLSSLVSPLFTMTTQTWILPPPNYSLSSRFGISQHYFLLRPIPSDSLPLVELKEDPDPVFDPKERDFNETELRTTLGDFDSRFLSIFQPSSDANSANEDFQEVQKPSGILPKEIRAVDFDAHLGKKQLKASKKLKRRLQQWLWAYSFCPVIYTWTDLGARFWPRFVRAGNCLNKRSCSVPKECSAARPIPRISPF